MRILWNLIRASMGIFFGTKTLRLFESHPGVAVTLGVFALVCLAWTVMDIIAGFSSGDRTASCCYGGVPILLYRLLSQVPRAFVHLAWLVMVELARDCSGRKSMGNVKSCGADGAESIFRREAQRRPPAHRSLIAGGCFPAAKIVQGEGFS